VSPVHAQIHAHADFLTAVLQVPDSLGCASISGALSLRASRDGTWSKAALHACWAGSALGSRGTGLSSRAARRLALPKFSRGTRIGLPMEALSCGEVGLGDDRRRAADNHLNVTGISAVYGDGVVLIELAVHRQVPKPVRGPVDGGPADVFAVASASASTNRAARLPATAGARAAKANDESAERWRAGGCPRRRSPADEPLASATSLRRPSGSTRRSSHGRRHGVRYV
jgi:hypothetical protein